MNGFIRKALFIFGISAVLNTSAQTPSRNMAMGYSVAAVSNPYNVNYNPGLLGTSTSEFGITGQNYYGLFNSFCAGGEFKRKNGAFGANFSSLTNSLLHYYSFGAGYGLKLDEKLHMGVALNYNINNLDIGAGVNSKTLTGSIGFAYLFSSKTTFGLSLVSPEAIFTADSARVKKPQMRFGISQRLSDKVLISADAFFNAQQRLLIGAGIEYSPINNWYLRGGYNTGYGGFVCGLGAEFGKVKVDITNAFVQPIGNSLSATFRLKLSKK